MKAFVLAEPGKVKWYDASEPTLSRDGVILSPVAVTPCTSDVHTVYGGGSPKAPNLILGHESIAKVIEVGEDVHDFKKGDFVAVPAITPNWKHPDIQDVNFKHAGGHFSGHQLGKSIPGVFAERFHVPCADMNLAKIPNGVSLEDALMCVDVVTTGFTGVEAAEVEFGDSVCVFGVGAIGLAAIMGARQRGAGRIVAVGSRKIGVEMAKKLGATDIVNYHNEDVVETVLNMTNQEGVDSVIVAGGGDEVFTQAVDIVKYGIGTIGNINYYGGTGNLGFPKFSGGRGMAGKTIKTELAKGGRRRIERLLSMVKYDRIHPQELVTHELMGLDSVEEALEMMRVKQPDLIKVMVVTDLEFARNWRKTNEKN